MAPFRNLYIIPFNPLGAPGPTILTAVQTFNKAYKHLKRGSAVTPYPDPVMVYCQSVVSNPGDDTFEDLYLDDLYSFFFSFLLMLS